MTQEKNMLCLCLRVQNRTCVLDGKTWVDILWEGKGFEITCVKSLLNPSTLYRAGVNKMYWDWPSFLTWALTFIAVFITSNGVVFLKWGSVSCAYGVRDCNKLYSRGHNTYLTCIFIMLVLLSRLIEQSSLLRTFTSS